MKSMGLYIHIPFCERKCYYCDFTSIAGNMELMKKYEGYLIKEIGLLSDKYGDCKVETIFIGGGTPSVLHGKSIANIMKVVKEGFNISDSPEITIEVNPGTITYEKAAFYKTSGINRISMGIQSMNDSSLRLIGRIHSKEQVFSTVQILRKAGFSNINGDVMFGLPHQTKEDFEETLREVIELNLEHISMYGLILEENTLLYNWYGKGLINIPDEIDERTMYHRGIRLLNENGYNQYEISNFARDDFKCRHNLGYWKLRPYIGAGLSSHSSMNNIRYWNVSSFKDYFSMIDDGSLPIGGEESISPGLQESEYLILGIRLTEGISLDDYEKRFGQSFMGKYKSVVDKHIASGLLKYSEGKIALTDRGLDLSNLVEVDFLP
ncbi:MAG: radical SAM family heme chaperone HemW [Bacillota bacterium]